MLAYFVFSAPFHQHVPFRDEVAWAGS